MKYITNISVFLILFLIIACKENFEKQLTLAANTSITKDNFLAYDPIWDDGKARISAYSYTNHQTLIKDKDTLHRVTTDTFVQSVVKHLYDLKKHQKATNKGSSTEEVWFHSFFNKRTINQTGIQHSASVILEKRSFKPFKVTFAEQSYEGNTYAEQRFDYSTSTIYQNLLGDGRSLPDEQWNFKEVNYPLEAIFFIVENLDFSKNDVIKLPFIGFKMKVPKSLQTTYQSGELPYLITFKYVGNENLTFKNKEITTQKIEVYYPEHIFPPFKALGHNFISRKETYWLSQENNSILKVESLPVETKFNDLLSKEYFTLELINSIRDDWWSRGENVKIPFKD